MRRSVITVKGFKYQIRAYTDAGFKRKHLDLSADTAACCMTNPNRIDFNLSALSMGIILHELLHAYVNSCSLESAHQLTGDVMEEICAMILQQHGTEMFSTANRLYNKFTRGSN